MKNKHSFRLTILLLALATSFMSACSWSTSNSKASSHPSSSNSWLPSSVSSNISDVSSINNSSSLSTISSSTVTNYPKTVDLYASNDFHGAINFSGYEMGAVKNFTYLKQKANMPNTVVLGSGDFFQGSVESNFNRGALLTELMMEAGFTAYVLGNHDFDWGSSYIIRNRNLIPQVSGVTKTVPFLGANIYDYDINTKTTGDFAENISEPYTTKILDNGLKVGVIGTIGSDQITSIISKYSDPYTFLNPATYVKTYSDQLRAEGCDIIVWDNHAGSEDTLTNSFNYDLTQSSPVSGKRYIDAVFTSHTHRYEKNIVNGVPVVQAGNNGRGVAHITLTVNSNGNTNCDKYTTYYTSEILSVIAEDQTIKQIVNHYGNDTSALASKVVGWSNSSFSQYNSSDSATVPNLVVAAAADYITKSNGLNDLGITAVISNQGRAELPNGNITYSDLFKAIPFDNNFLVMNVRGDDILKETLYSRGGIYDNSTYLMDINQTYSSSTYYKIAVIDYIGTHRNSNRNYDYFASLATSGEIIGSINQQGGLSLPDEENEFNYRDITENYIESLPNKQLNYSNYIYNIGHFCVDNIQN